MSTFNTRRVPEPVREWLSKSAETFPAEWTLVQVAEESRRRFLAGRWANEIEASRAVTHWGAFKLAKERTFDSQCWDWLIGLGPYQPGDLYSRLVGILEPAFGSEVAWRATDADRSELLKEIGDKAKELLTLIDTERKLDIDFSQVVGQRPELQPLLDRAFEIQQKRTRQIQEWNRARREGLELDMPPSEFPGFIAGPRLSDYLSSLLALILGDAKRAYPNFRLDLPGEVDSDDGDDEDWELDPAELNKLLGFGVDGALDPRLLRASGDFGKVPTRKDALIRAVINAFPAAIYSRWEEPPASCTPARLIEAACIAWFGVAPTQKEINSRIKDARNRLEPSMRRAINSAIKSREQCEQWEQQGLSPAEIQKKELQSFLDKD